MRGIVERTGDKYVRFSDEMTANFTAEAEVFFGKIMFIACQSIVAEFRSKPEQDLLYLCPRSSFLPFPPMPISILLLIACTLLAAILVVTFFLSRRPPDGFEDERGFHFGAEPTQRSK